MLVHNDGRVEPFWELLRNCINIKEEHLTIIYGAIAFIALSIKIPILLKIRFGIIATLLYLLSLFLLHEYTQIRIALSLAAAYVILNRISHSESALSFFIYLIPSLFHYSLAPLVLLPFLSHARFTFFVGIIILCILSQGAQLELLLEIVKPKFGDDSQFYILNILSSYFFIIHAIFFFYLRSYLPKNIVRFHNAAIIFILISIPFGLLQFGTAYFRFQEVSASLMLPVIFAGIASKRGLEAASWYVVAGGYYVMLSAKIIRDFT